MRRCATAAPPVQPDALPLHGPEGAWGNSLGLQPQECRLAFGCALKGRGRSLRDAPAPFQGASLFEPTFQGLKPLAISPRCSAALQAKTIQEIADPRYFSCARCRPPIFRTFSQSMTPVRAAQSSYILISSAAFSG